MQTGIFLEYNSYVDGIKNQLLILYNKFQNSRLQLENDYQAGLITEQDYEYIKSLRIYSYDSNVPARYMLSKDEAEYVRTYGEFDQDGLLLLGMVNDQIREKQNNFNCIWKSIEVFYRLDNVDEKKKKELFIADINDSYMAQITSCEKEIDRLKVALGENYYSSLTCQKLREKLRMLTQERDKLIADVLKSNYSQFIQIVETFYGVNLEYYNWYKRRYIKEECESEIEVMDQSGKIVDALGNALEVSEKLAQASNLHSEIASTTDLMISLSSELVKDGLEETGIRKKGLFSRKKKKGNNQDELRKIFNYYSKFSGFRKFIEQFIEVDEEVDLDMAFTKYYAKVYGSCSYVEPFLFKKRLILEMIDSFKKRLEEKNEQLKGTMEGLNLNSQTLNQQIGEIKTHEFVRKYYSDNQDDLSSADAILVDLGFSTTEIARMYEDINNFINTNLKKENLNGPILNLKAGN